MKEMKALEMQLRSWELRHPSARIKQQLFSDPRVEPDRMAWSFQWLAPAAACLLFAGMILNQSYQHPVVATQSDPGLTLALSNQSAQVSSPGAALSPTTNPARNRIEWTNGTAFTSSVTSFLPGKVN